MSPELAPTGRLRAAFFAAASAQHALVAAATYSRPGTWGPMMLVLAPSHLAVLAWVLFRRLPAEDGEHPAAPMLWTIAAAVVCAMLTAPLAGGRLVPALLGCALNGALVGAAQAVVYAPLLGLAHAWRRSTSLAQRLDAWAALGLYAAIAAALVIASTDVAGPRRIIERSAGLGVLAVGTAVVVVGCELWWRRQIGRAHRGLLPGTRVVNEPAALHSGALDWSLMASARKVALVAAGEERGYRDAGGREVIALLPTHAQVSWRVFVLSAAIVAAIALGVFHSRPAG
jgi:hypothetical protein